MSKRTGRRFGLTKSQRDRAMMKTRVACRRSGCDGAESAVHLVGSKGSRRGYKYCETCGWEGDWWLGAPGKQVERDAYMRAATAAVLEGRRLRKQGTMLPAETRRRSMAKAKKKKKKKSAKKAKKKSMKKAKLKKAVKVGGKRVSVVGVVREMLLKNPDATNDELFTAVKKAVPDAKVAKNSMRSFFCHYLRKRGEIK